MDEVFENPYADAPEKPWTKVQIVAATALVFTLACCSSVVVEKSLTKLLKLPN